MMCVCLPLSATTWYVRHDGGTRFSSIQKAGLCDGKADAVPVGTTPNQHCAFNDVRMLWQDGSYTTGGPFPSWGWIGAGGDTYIIKGSIAEGITYRADCQADGDFVSGFPAVADIDEFGSGAEIAGDRLGAR